MKVVWTFVVVVCCAMGFSLSALADEVVVPTAPVKPTDIPTSQQYIITNHEGGGYKVRTVADADTPVGTDGQGIYFVMTAIDSNRIILDADIGSVDASKYTTTGGKHYYHCSVQLGGGADKPLTFLTNDYVYFSYGTYVITGNADLTAANSTSVSTLYIQNSATVFLSGKYESRDTNYYSDIISTQHQSSLIMEDVVINSPSRIDTFGEGYHGVKSDSASINAQIVGNTNWVIESGTILKPIQTSKLFMQGGRISNGTVYCSSINMTGGTIESTSSSIGAHLIYIEAKGNSVISGGTLRNANGHGIGVNNFEGEIVYKLSILQSNPSIETLIDCPKGSAVKINGHTNDPSRTAERFNMSSGKIIGQVIVNGFGSASITGGHIESSRTSELFNKETLIAENIIISNSPTVKHTGTEAAISAYNLTISGTPTITGRVSGQITNSKRRDIIVRGVITDNGYNGTEALRILNNRIENYSGETAIVLGVKNVDKWQLVNDGQSFYTANGNLYAIVDTVSLNFLRDAQYDPSVTFNPKQPPVIDIYRNGTKISTGEVAWYGSMYSFNKLGYGDCTVYIDGKPTDIVFNPAEKREVYAFPITIGAKTHYVFEHMIYPTSFAHNNPNVQTVIVASYDGSDVLIESKVLNTELNFTYSRKLDDMKADFKEAASYYKIFTMFTDDKQPTFPVKRIAA